MDLPNVSELRAKAQRNRLDFLQTDLALCFTFADLVDTELKMGDREAALCVYVKAEEGHTTISRFVVDLDNGPQKKAIQQRLTELRTRLDLSHSRLHGE